MKLFVFCLVLSFVALIELSHQTCSPEFERQFVAKHNALRARHGVPSLVFDDYLQNRAQESADRMAQAGRLPNRRESVYGQNIYVSWSNNGVYPNAENLVQSWYNEIDNYAPYFGDEPDMDSTNDWAYFTQLVWRNSRRIGVGCSVYGDAVFVVAKYDPAGNVNGQYRNNVIMPRTRNWRRFDNYPSTMYF